MLTLTLESIVLFIELNRLMFGDSLRANQFAMDQLLAFCQGERGAQLHDNCVVLLDGLKEVGQ